MGVVEDMIRRDGFSFRLRIGMATADVRTGEMADEIGICDSYISNIKSEKYAGSKETRRAMLNALERRRPGTLAAIRAAELALQPLIRRHDLERTFTGQLAGTKRRRRSEQWIG